MSTRSTLIPLFIVMVLFSQALVQAAAWEDNFDDGVIDAAKWVVGGDRRGFDGDNTGPWQWSQQEVLDTDGYLQSLLWGPETANTFGGDVWVRTTFDFNDGNTHTVNITWSLDAQGALNVNGLAIQVTDGALYSGTDIKWPNPTRVQDPGWQTIYMSNNIPTTSKRTWSVVLDSVNNDISVYDSANGQGLLLGSDSYDLSRAWYLRLVYIDGSAAGLGSGYDDLRIFRVFDVPEPASLVLLGACAVAATYRRHTPH